MIYESYVCVENTRDKQTGKVTRWEMNVQAQEYVGWEMQGKQWEDIQDNKS